jgi:hypothetical protein
VNLTPQLAHGVVTTQQLLGSNTANRENHSRLNQPDLPLKVLAALIRLILMRVAIPGRPAFEDIGNVGRIARQADRCQHPIQELPCSSDKWLTAPIFLGAWRLSDDHPVRRRVADAKYRLRPGCVQCAARAVFDLLTQGAPVRGLDGGCRNIRRLPGIARTERQPDINAHRGKVLEPLRVGETVSFRIHGQ